MPTYLLTWNPNKWPWTDLQEEVAKISKKGFLLGTWSCGTVKGIQKRDRIFLMRQSVEPRGIFASGFAASTVFEDGHWDHDLDAAGKKANYIDVRFDHLFNPEDQIVPRLELKKLGKMHWDAEMSGTRIPDDVADKLEMEWSRFVKQAPDVNEFEPLAVEGLLTETIHYSRGRSEALRKQALAKANGVCAACETDFKKLWNGKGVRVLQVHHLKQMASSDTPRLTKLSDLAVVCANCHMLIHINPQRSMPIAKLRLELTKV